MKKGCDKIDGHKTSDYKLWDHGVQMCACSLGYETISTKQKYFGKVEVVIAVGD